MAAAEAGWVRSALIESAALQVERDEQSIKTIKPAARRFLAALFACIGAKSKSPGRRGLLWSLPWLCHLHFAPGTLQHVPPDSPYLFRQFRDCSDTG